MEMSNQKYCCLDGHYYEIDSMTKKNYSNPHIATHQKVLLVMYTSFKEVN